MAFGKKRNNLVDENDTHVSETQDFIDLDDGVQETPAATAATGSKPKKRSAEIDATKPLLDEVTYKGVGNGKNPGGCKQWVCNHCSGTFTSTYTRIQYHFFGADVGKKADIVRCPAMLRDREKYQRLLNKVKQAEYGGVSKSLKTSVLSKSSSSKKRIEESFGILERNAVDLKILRGLCANGIPFNVLRNPQFLEMVSAIQHAPDGYKP